MNLDSINPFNLSTIRTLFTPIDFGIVPANLVRAIGNLVKSIGNISETVSGAVFYPIHFTELQTILLTVFLVIFSINLALIGVYWQKYGGVITDRFIRPSEFDLENRKTEHIEGLIYVCMSSCLAIRYRQTHASVCIDFSCVRP